jgi:hypothetical protein
MLIIRKEILLIELFIDGRIEAAEKSRRDVLAGWNIFKEKLAVKLGNDYDVNAVEEAVRLSVNVPKIAIQSSIVEEEW